MKNEDEICRSFRSFGESIKGRENIVQSYFYKLHNAIKYGDADNFVEIFSKLLMSSDYKYKSELFDILNQDIGGFEGTRGSSLNLMQVALLSFLSGYYRSNAKR